MKKCGFTLIELVIVLFILSLAAHLAVREVSKSRQMHLKAAADAQLEQIALAVFDGSVRGKVPSGFLADMGRLPVATADADGRLSLSELFVKPEGVGECRARPATPENLAPGAPPEIADSTMLVPCGWGGPYLASAATAGRLRDPWGNLVETPDDAGLSRLVATNAAGTTAEGFAVVAVRHFGSDGVSDDFKAPATDEARDAEKSLDFASSGILLVFEPGSVSNVCWYAPLGDKVTGGFVKINPGDTQHLVRGLTPGRRFVKFYPTSSAPVVKSVILDPGRDTVLEF